MKKINAIRTDKVWGYEIWLYSPVKNKETTLEDGSKTTHGPLVKIINATQPLSVQVHPDDKLAMELENEKNGKSESWYVLDHKPNATLVLGLSTYDNEKIKEALKNKTFNNLLKQVEIKKGDFINVPAGLVHGIGAGITVLEVQQPSEITYRYYDYDRLENGQLRELHIDKALRSQKQLSFHLEPSNFNPLTFQNKVGTQKFVMGEHVLDSESIVVNLETYESFIANKGEKINFNHWAIISL